MALNSKTLGIIILVVIFGGIALSSAMGYWHTENTSRGNERTSENGADPNRVDDEEESINGQTTFQDLLDLGLSPEAIEQVIEGPLPMPTLRIKDYCEENGLKFGTVKSNLQFELDRLDG